MCILFISINQLTGNWDFLDGHVETLENACIWEVAKAQNITVDDTISYDDESGTIITDDEKDIKKTICPGQCSKHGECNNGTCNCSQGDSFRTLHMNRIIQTYV